MTDARKRSQRIASSLSRAGQLIHYDVLSALLFAGREAGEKSGDAHTKMASRLQAYCAAHPQWVVAR